jgi:ABC-type multidrug transport system permease subunit
MSPRKSRTGDSTSFKSTPPLLIAQSRASRRFRRFRPLFARTLVVSCISYYGSFVWVILIGVNAFYVTSTTIVFICAVATAGRYGHISLVPYVIGYSLFSAYVMRMLMVSTYVDECFLRSSYRDSFVPSRVLKRKP